jgi:hypothetical protein
MNKALQAATDRIKVIVSACGTDPRTGQLLVPRKFATEYSQQLGLRDELKLQIAELGRHLQVFAADVQRRVLNPALLGSSVRPELQVLGPIPDEWIALEHVLSDAAVAGMLDRLEGELRTRLRPENWDIESGPGGESIARADQGGDFVIDDITGGQIESNGDFVE